VKSQRGEVKAGCSQQATTVPKRYFASTSLYCLARHLSAEILELHRLDQSERPLISSSLDATVCKFLLMLIYMLRVSSCEYQEEIVDYEVT
jgi:hypothetical protein